MSSAKVFITAAFFAWLAGGVSLAQPNPELSGSILKFECGDNCYLTIKTSEGREITGLCMAKECVDWNKEGEIPEALIGARVRVILGIGNQYNGEGDLMGRTKSFTSIRFFNNLVPADNP